MVLRAVPLDIAVIGFAAYATLAFKQGGARRLWRDTAIALLIAVLAWQVWPDVEIAPSDPGGLGGAGTYTWPLPLAVLGMSATLQLLAFVPRWVPWMARGLLAALLGLFVSAAGFWIS